MAEKSKRILAVDDEEDLVKMMRMVLTEEGYEVHTALNGTDGIALAEQLVPDLIILDLMMPDVHGFKVLDKLKENKATESIPVIVLTAVTERDAIQHALAHGVSSFLTKPFVYEDLVAKVREALAEP